MNELIGVCAYCGCPYTAKDNMVIYHKMAFHKGCKGKVKYIGFNYWQKLKEQTNKRN